MKKRTLALLCAVTMVIGIAVGGSLAWLVSKPDSVTNTFTTSDVDITLTEPAGENAEVKYHFQMVPGKTITKDPKVTVTAGSLDSYILGRSRRARTMTPSWSLMRSQLAGRR